MSLDNLYNYNYGSRVVTNGNYVAIGNPPGKDYEICEGFGRIGQVFLIKKDKFNSNYTLQKIYTKHDYTNIFPYYTEQSSSAALTASFFYESGSASDYSRSGSLLTLEDGNTYVYQSDYGKAIDLSNYFLAIGDTYFSASMTDTDTENGYASVEIFEINPNYVYDSTYGVIFKNKNQLNYILPELPICSITGSIEDEFGYSVSISDNYLAIGAPNANAGRGIVYLYKYADSDFYCKYSLETTMSLDNSTYPHQQRFGSSLSFDKKNEDKLVVGSTQLSQSNVYVYFNSGSTSWSLSQVFNPDTSSNYYKLDDSDYTFYPSGSQINNRYGHSVYIHDDILAVGAPNDLVYWEYSGSDQLRQRGSVYVYQNEQCSEDVDCNFKLLTKLYGDSNTFKDNLFGYSVSVFNKKILIGSPKPYFPFSSFFISESINYYSPTITQNDLAESTYCGQTLLYEVSDSQITQVTTTPIGKRKQLGKPYNAFGYSVSIADENLVIGAPIPLNDDFHLSALMITETGSAADADYIETSSFQSDECGVSSKFVYTNAEFGITSSLDKSCLYSISGALSGSYVVFVDEQGDYLNMTSEIFGTAHIYDDSDLQSNYTVGNVFYNTNTLVLNNTGSVLQDITLDPLDDSKTNVYMNYNTQLSIFEKQFICTIEPGEFNISTNPSAITSSLFDYGVINQDKNNFENLDIILRYINFNITYPQSEKWWETFVSGQTELSIFGYYSSSIHGFENTKLNNELLSKCNDIDFDVNGDGVVTSQDGILIWKYFIKELKNSNYRDYLTQRSKRTNYTNIINFLDEKFGKFVEKKSLPEFFEYKALTDNDPTGSYLAPYITTVGLYSDGDLVAVAKLAHPIKNTGEIPINIVVKWDT